MSKDIDDFYAEFGYQTSFLITAEELFPLLRLAILELRGSVDLGKVFIDVQFVSMFLSDYLKYGEVGFVINTFMALI